MTYPEYLSCARKHLYGCEALLKSYNAGQEVDMHVWLELYYMMGYFVEGITVYSVYKLYGWDPSRDIQRCYDLSFSRRTNLDFFYNRRCRDQRTGEDTTPDFFLNRPPGAMSVQGHRFKDIVDNLLKFNPAFRDSPYLGDGEIDSVVRRLIDDWSPKVRYYYDDLHPNIILNKDILFKLIGTCHRIYIDHI